MERIIPLLAVPDLSFSTAINISDQLESNPIVILLYFAMPHRVRLQILQEIANKFACHKTNGKPPGKFLVEQIQHYTIQYHNAIIAEFNKLTGEAYDTAI